MITLINASEVIFCSILHISVIANHISFEFIGAILSGPIHYCESISAHPLISKDTVVYEVTTPYLSGLYILQNAIPLHAQIKLAKLAVEEYSMAEHTNLTNLKRLEEESSTLQGSPEDEPKQLSKPYSRPEENSDMDESLWHRSVAENNDFKSFFRLRWSSLGYHYGIPTPGKPLIHAATNTYVQFYNFNLFPSSYVVVKYLLTVPSCCADWTERRYRKNLKSVFPSELSSLCKAISSMILRRPSCTCKGLAVSADNGDSGDSGSRNSCSCPSSSSSSSSSSVERVSGCGHPFEYEPEAAIVNYYPCALGTCMGGHKG